MPRTRNPNRAKAHEIYKEHGGNITNREIAKLLGEDEKVIAVWKNRDRWNDVQQSNECCTTNTGNKKKRTNKKAIADEVGQVIGNPELTDKQRLFCCLYIKCFNATKAYQKAYGCSYETALTNGSALLGNTRIKEEIRRLKQNRLNREMLSEEDIFQKYMDIAFADITDYVEFGREIVPVMGPFGPVMIKDEKTGKKTEIKKEINVIRFRESIEVDGTLIVEVKQGKDGASIKLADRMKALQWISDHMDLATAEQRAKIEALRSQVSRKEGTKEQAQDWKAAVIEVAKRRKEVTDGRTD
ncbi:MAG: terminase small subunit [Lachnospiraceae bacterium]|nr:terminase small subunit [Lachnospiraceae bacterium]